MFYEIGHMYIRSTSLSHTEYVQSPETHSDLPIPPSYPYCPYWGVFVMYRCQILFNAFLHIFRLRFLSFFVLTLYIIFIVSKNISISSRWWIWHLIILFSLLQGPLLHLIWNNSLYSLQIGYNTHSLKLFCRHDDQVGSTLAYIF